jgi:hypothetical protein
LTFDQNSFNSKVEPTSTTCIKKPWIPFEFQILTWYSYKELQVEPLGLKEWDLVQKWEIATIEC